MNQHQKSNYSEMDKLMLAFATIMGLTLMFASGASLDEKNWFTLVYGGLASLLFIGIVIVVVRERTQTLKDKLTAAERDLEMARNRKEVEVPAHPLPPQAGAAIDRVAKMLAEKHSQDFEMLQAIYKDVVGGFGPNFVATPEQVAKIEAAFHDNTDKYLHIDGIDESGVTFQTSDKPIETVPGRSDAHEAARLRGNAASAAEPTKPLTKSQQRRINASKGHGPITDDELKAKRNEARRAKRAAKKPADEQAGKDASNKSEPLPGQTELPINPTATVPKE
jgi:hypothetical protein